ncbi:gluconate kinase [Rhodoplanes elegans]|uniref:Gluconokinase n=1 Tax=Rhodoplanes elegans TaxID=29408 RepID=A0A327K950_9BRAD|nr:gluconokinase [Rhodoplanes elegans]MBK5958035.1 gluconate kinase [Rhodoplanes elegans]RAI35200.1 gluconate kinase [Rhodoplanes elegans]
MIVVLMGVSGSGKTTIGMLLAAKLGCGFSDADSFHPPANVEKMRAGVALNDDDRWPWLLALRKAIEDWEARGLDHVLACSALKQAYREILAPWGDVTFVYLKGSAELIAPRLAARTGHYMNPALLDSQFATLEEPAGAVTVDIANTPDEIVAAILTALGRSPQGLSHAAS